jgi:hypothetical protein
MTSKHETGECLTCGGGDRSGEATDPRDAVCAAVDRYMSTAVPYGKDVAMRAIVDAWAVWKGEPRTTAATYAALGGKSVRQRVEEIRAQQAGGLTDDEEEKAAKAIVTIAVRAREVWLRRARWWLEKYEPEVRSLATLLASVHGEAIELAAEVCDADGSCEAQTLATAIRRLRKEDGHG